MPDSLTENAFLRAILADPDDDAPRLIYADWLDENGDADRAEFIRLQVQLARLSHSDPDWGPLSARSHELKQARYMEWLNQLPQFDGVHWEIFDRGFISAARFDGPDAYFNNAVKVFEAAPINELRFHQFTWPNAVRLAESKHLRHVCTLDFHDGNRVANNGIEGLMKSPHLVNLISLNLSRNSLGSAGVRAIAMAPYVRSLRKLTLDRNDLYDDALRFLSESPNSSQLQSLDLDYTRVGADGVKSLAASKYIRQLRVIQLNGNSIGDEGLTALADSDVMAKVHTLYLEGNHIGDAGIMALTRSTKVRRLERLYLRRNVISDDGAFALAHWHHALRLRELHVDGNPTSELGKSELESHLGKVAYAR